MDDALEAVRTAIAMEEKAAHFYRQAAQKTGDPQAAEILNSFADDEVKHGQLLKSLAEGYYLRQGRFEIPEITPTEYHQDRPGPIFCRDLEDLARNPEPVPAAVDRFAQAEGEAIELYRRLAAQSQDPALAGFYAKLADWEQRHLDLLRKQAETFKLSQP